MRSLLLRAILATLVFYIWGFVALGLMPYNPFVQVSDQDAVAAALTENMRESGTYLIPNYSSVEEDEVEWTRRHEEGPIAMIFFRREGTSPMNKMLPGFIRMLFSVVLMALLLRIVLPALPGYGKRVAFVAFVGFVATFWITVAIPIWWNQPWGFHLYSFFYNVVGWSLVGPVLAKFVRPEAGMAAEIAE